MKTKRIFLLVLSALLSAALLSGCGSETDAPATTDPASTTAPTGQTTGSDEEEPQDIIFIEDGDTYELLVTYGKEFILPAPYQGEENFVGWVTYDGLFQPGDKLIATEFLSISALRSSPEEGTLMAIDPVQWSTFSVISSEEIELESAYMNLSPSDMDTYFLHWEDPMGQTYEDRAAVRVAPGEVLVLQAVYSDDLSMAYKIEVCHCLQNDSFDFHFYVKKGASLALSPSMWEEGLSFDGWYDAPEGGNRIADEYETFTPSSDTNLYAHWIHS